MSSAWKCGVCDTWTCPKCLEVIGKDKNDLPFARRQELEKRLDKPSVKKRIDMIAKRMFKDVRKKEVERKKG